MAQPARGPPFLPQVTLPPVGKDTRKVYSKKRWTPAKRAYRKRPGEVYTLRRIPGLTPKQMINWMYRSEKWRNHDSNIWRAKTVLGVGGGGGAMLFRYEPVDNALPQNPGPGVPSHFVAKQSRRWNGLQNESAIMRALLDSPGGPQHCIKIYKLSHTDPGSGTTNFDKNPLTNFDPRPTVNDINEDTILNPRKYVSRIYMEYCPNGDLQDAMNAVAKHAFERELPSNLPEQYIWQIFECLALALLKLETGSEDTTAGAPAPWRTPIVHFDIKLDNLFFCDNDAAHPNLPLLKLADFGSALPIPPIPFATNDPKWRAATRGLSLAAETPPEQLLPDKKLHIDSPANVWQVGSCMYQIMMQLDVFQTEVGAKVGMTSRERSFIRRRALTGEDEPWLLTYGDKLLDSDYSPYLVGLVHRCLAHHTDQRITPRELLQKIRPVLAEYQRTLASHSIPAKLDDPDLPLLNVPPPLHQGHPPRVKPVIAQSSENTQPKPLPWNQRIMIPAGTFSLGNPLDLLWDEQSHQVQVVRNHVKGRPAWPYPRYNAPDKWEGEDEAHSG